MTGPDHDEQEIERLKAASMASTWEAMYAATWDTVSRAVSAANRSQEKIVARSNRLEP
jgi:hypothetical protein